MRHILLLTLFKQSAAIEFFSVLTATLILFPTFTKYHILTVFVFSFLVSLQIILYHRIVLLLFFYTFTSFFLSSCMRCVREQKYFLQFYFFYRGSLFPSICLELLIPTACKFIFAGSLSLALVESFELMKMKRRNNESEIK